MLHVSNYCLRYANVPSTKRSAAVKMELGRVKVVKVEVREVVDVDVEVGAARAEAL